MSFEWHKNKCGSRGQVEEEEKPMKKTDMAESGDQETELNLAEIKIVLLQIRLGGKNQ